MQNNYIFSKDTLQYSGNDGKNKITLGRRQSKTKILSRNVDKKSLETEFSIAICRHCGNKWQSKTLFLSIFDPRLSIVDSTFDCHLSGVKIDTDKGI